MLVNSIQKISYRDGIVSFELVYNDPKNAPAKLEPIRVDMPFERLDELNGIMSEELGKIAVVHRSWLEKKIEDMGKPSPVKKPAAPKKTAEDAKTDKAAQPGPDRPKTGRMLKKL
jgi:hypothetical protein